MNKGEWSELYTFLRLLADGKLYAADADLNKIENEFYPIIKIIRQSKNHKNPLFYMVEEGKIAIVASENETQIKQIPTEDFSINAEKLLKIIKSSKASFEAEEIQEFTSHIESPLAKEKSSSKRDITIIVHDINIGHQKEIGFSIKSQLGGASTLFNANVSNNLCYKIDGICGLNHDVLEELKTLKAKKLVKKLNENNCEVIFEGVADDYFESNLLMVDSNFPIIIAEILKLYYSGYATRIKELTEKVADINPCNYPHNETFPFYEHKIKSFLTACALGMTSKKPWNGNFDVSGGYIIVKESGDIVCYHIYNWNDFQQYLFNSTFIDTPSTTRHKFGRLDGDKLNLNFQIRFR